MLTKNNIGDQYQRKGNKSGLTIAKKGWTSILEPKFQNSRLYLWTNFVKAMRKTLSKYRYPISQKRIGIADWARQQIANQIICYVLLLSRTACGAHRCPSPQTDWFKSNSCTVHNPAQFKKEKGLIPMFPLGLIITINDSPCNREIRENWIARLFRKK